MAREPVPTARPTFGRRLLEWVAGRVAPFGCTLPGPSPGPGVGRSLTTGGRVHLSFALTCPHPDVMHQIVLEYVNEGLLGGDAWFSGVCVDSSGGWTAVLHVPLPAPSLYWQDFDVPRRGVDWWLDIPRLFDSSPLFCPPSGNRHLGTHDRNGDLIFRRHTSLFVTGERVRVPGLPTAGHRYYLYSPVRHRRLTGYLVVQVRDGGEPYPVLAKKITKYLDVSDFCVT